MIHLVQIIGDSLSSYTSSSMSDHSWLFLGPFFLVKMTLQRTISALKSFKGMIRKLTTVDLSTVEGRLLAGKTLFLGGVDKLISRLEEILVLRSAYAQTFNLLSAEQRSELIALDAFEVSCVVCGVIYHLMHQLKFIVFVEYTITPNPFASTSANSLSSEWMH